MIAFGALLLILATQPGTAPASSKDLTSPPQANPHRPTAAKRHAEGKHETVASSNSAAMLMKRLAGVWEQAPDAETGIGIWLALNADGTAVLSSGVMEDFNYNFDGKKLIVVDADDPEDVKQISTIALNGDRMVETNTENGQSAAFVRVAIDGKTPLAGAWKRDLSNEKPAADLAPAEVEKRRVTAESGRYYYTADGRLYVRIPVDIQRGTWTTQDGKLMLTLGDKQQESTVHLNDAERELTLSQQGGQQTYHRADY